MNLCKNLLCLIFDGCLLLGETRYPLLFKKFHQVVNHMTNNLVMAYRKSGIHLKGISPISAPHMGSCG